MSHVELHPGIKDISAGIFIFLLGFGFFSYGFIWLRQKRLIENTPTSKIRSIAMGLVEIKGQVLLERGKTLKTPFLNKDCIYYEYYIEEYQTYLDSKGQPKSKWVVLDSGSNSTNFYLKDDTGSVLVDPRGANISRSYNYHHYKFDTKFEKDFPENIKRFVIDNKLDFEKFLGLNKRIKYREVFIAPKDELYIFGTAGDNPFKEEATSRKGVEDIMIQRGNYNKKRPYDNFYCISNKSEREILEKFKWKVPLSIFGGVLLMIVGLIVILKYFNLL